MCGESGFVYCRQDQTQNVAEPDTTLGVPQGGIQTAFLSQSRSSMAPSKSSVGETTEEGKT